MSPRELRVAFRAMIDADGRRVVRLSVLCPTQYREVELGECSRCTHVTGLRTDDRELAVRVLCVPDG